MIKSCKYCLSHEHLCPRCEGPVLLRNIVIMDKHGAAHSTSVILCENLECAAYGVFQQQTTYSIEVFVCAACELKTKEAHVTTEHQSPIH